MKTMRVAWRVQSQVLNTRRTVTTVITIIIIIIITITMVTITMVTNTAGTQVPPVRRPCPLAVQQQVVIVWMI